MINIRVCARQLLTSQLHKVSNFFCILLLFLCFSGISVGTPLTGDLMDSENIDHSRFAPIGMYAGTLPKLIKRACLGTSFSVTFRWETFSLLSNSSTQAWNKVPYSSEVLERKFEQHKTYFLLIIRERINFYVDFGGGERQFVNLLNDFHIYLVWTLEVSMDWLARLL